MVRVYVAGPYSADNIIECLQNIGHGESVCADLFCAGLYPFCPWHDKDYVIKNWHRDQAVEQFYRYSMAWLEVSDCMLVLDGWENSKGTKAEMAYASDTLGIPIYFSVSALLADYVEVA